MQPYFIVYIAIICGGLSTAVYRWRKLSQSSRWSAILLFVTLASEVLAQTLVSMRTRNLFVYHFFIPVQLFIVYKSLTCEIGIRRHNLIPLGFVLFCLLTSIFLQPLKEFPSISNHVGSFIISIFSLVYLRKLLDSPSIRPFTQYPPFWISSGWLFFNVLTLFHFGAYNYLLKNQGEATYTLLWNMRVFSNYILYLCYWIAMCTTQETLTNSPPEDDDQ